MVAVAQLVEPQVVVLVVAGSIPVCHPRTVSPRRGSVGALLYVDEAGIERRRRYTRRA